MINSVMASHLRLQKSMVQRNPNDFTCVTVDPLTGVCKKSVLHGHGSVLLQFVDPAAGQKLVCFSSALCTSK